MNKKLKAWEYINFNDDERGNFLKKIFPGDNKYPSPVKASELLNSKAGFPLTEPRVQSGRVIAKIPDSLKDYCKDILDKNGKLLPSRNVQKAA